MATGILSTALTLIGWQSLSMVFLIITVPALIDLARRSGQVGPDPVMGGFPQHRGQFAFQQVVIARPQEPAEHQKVQERPQAGRGGITSSGSPAQSV